MPVERPANTAQAIEETRQITAKEAEQPPKVEDQPPDPVLEEAIQRFIKTMFRSLAAAEEAGLLPPFDQAKGSPQRRWRIQGASAAYSGRSALSARIEALANRLSHSPVAGASALDIGSTCAPVSSPLLPVRPRTAAPVNVGAAMDQAFAEVMQVLQGQPRWRRTSPADHARRTGVADEAAGHGRAGPAAARPWLLPTRGGLLSERA